MLNLIRSAPSARKGMQTMSKSRLFACCVMFCTSHSANAAGPAATGVLHVGQVEILAQASGSYVYAPNKPLTDFSDYHMVTSMGVALEPGGRVVGFIEKANCEVLGLWKESRQGGIELGVSLTKCWKGSFNGRYTGALKADPNGSQWLYLSTSRNGGGAGVTHKFSIQGALYPR